MTVGNKIPTEMTQKCNSGGLWGEMAPERDVQYRKNYVVSTAFTIHKHSYVNISTTKRNCVLT